MLLEGAANPGGSRVLASHQWRGLTRDGRLRALIVAAGLLVLCALFMFVDPRTPPIIIWDESRLAVNALEMNQRGWSLVTTYGFAPDLWNSKPPLMIWLMNASMTLFGRSELALRLPAMLAALGTLLVVFGFVWRVTRSVAAAALAMILLAASAAFYGEHGARTADYDSLLCFFTTSYLSVLFFAVHRHRPTRRQLAVAGALIAGAVMTKTIAGLLPGAGVALYLLVSRRLGRAFATPRYVVMVLAALIPLASFYLLRERLVPGYLHAVWYNDFAGRYENQLGQNAKPWWIYLKALLYSGIFSAGPFALFAPVGLVGATGQSRQALLYALCCVAAELVLISIPATRLIQYVLPAVPWLAIACAIAVHEQVERFFRRSAPPRAAVVLAPALAAVAIVSIAVPAVKIRYEILPQRAFYPRASYGALFQALHDRGIRRVTVIEPGINDPGVSAYAPQLRYYSLLWNARGMDIYRARQFDGRTAGAIVASCDPAWSRALLSMGGHVIGSDGCSMVAPHPTIASRRPSTARDGSRAV
jgi:4-amino-4-deoxy-L-arabinose transferase-like glycosyltransferase